MSTGEDPHDARDRALAVLRPRYSGRAPDPGLPPVLDRVADLQLRQLAADGRGRVPGVPADPFAGDGRWALRWSRAGPHSCSRPTGASWPTASTGVWIGRWTFALQGVAAGGMAVMSFLGGLTRAGDLRADLRARASGLALGLPAMLALVPALVPRRAVRAGRGAQRRRGERRAAGRAGDRRGSCSRLVGATWCFGLERLLVPGADPRAVLGARAAHRAARGARLDATRAGVCLAGRGAAAPHAVGIAVFAALAAPIQELAPVIAHTLGAGATGSGCCWVPWAAGPWSGPGPSIACRPTG